MRPRPLSRPAESIIPPQSFQTIRTVFFASMGNMVREFWKAEAGAIAVDWTVLTGALVGLGIATIAIVSNGTETVSTGISDTLAGIILEAEDFLYLSGFDDGPGDWLNGIVTDGGALGALLGPFGGTGGGIGTSKTFDIPPGTETATFTFDMVAIDSWDSEEFIVFVDGAPAASLRFQHDSEDLAGQWVSDNPAFSFEVLDVGTRQHSGYNGDWTDQVATVRLGVSNPGATVTLGFGATLNQGLEDESFGIDNVSLQVS
jgi:Flp pilus assembly pilin Flp